jgi:polysaccharide export outer membrane protein
MKMNPLLLVCGVSIWLALGTGCQTTPPAGSAMMGGDFKALEMREGDTVRIAFPGAPNLDTTQQIRRDGKVAVPSLGEVDAANVTPADLEKRILQLFGGQLVTKQVSVTLLTSSYPVFVTGAVVRPGKIETPRPLTALEAIMEAGGFDAARANLEAVRVIRNEAGTMKHYTLNLRAVLTGRETKPFYLKPSDIVVVPEKFNWF